MKKLLCISSFLLFIVCTLILSGCTTEENPPEPEVPPVDPDPITTNALSLPTAAGLNATNLTPGYRTGQMPLTEEKSWIYTISVPEEVEDTPVPLIIALHGGNGDAGASAGFMECLPFPAFKNMEAIIFAPTGGQWWSELHSERVVEFVRLAKLHWPIDSTKVAVTGYSNGGTGSVHFAKNFPQTFSAAIPMAADYMKEICPQIPTYLIHGEQDEFYSPTALQQVVDRMQSKGCDIQLHLVSGATHGSACQMVAELIAAGLWLEMEIWKE